MFTSAVLMLSLAAANAVPPSHASPPSHHTSVAGPHHPSVHFSTGTLAPVCTNASWLDRLFGKRDECSLVDPQGTSAERAYYQACARHGTTGLLDCHIGYTFRYVTAPERGGGQFAACFRGCAPFLAEVQRAEDARRSEQIPMVFGAVQAVEERVLADIPMPGEERRRRSTSTSPASHRSGSSSISRITEATQMTPELEPLVHAILADLDSDDCDIACKRRGPDTGEQLVVEDQHGTIIGTSHLEGGKRRLPWRGDAGEPVFDCYYTCTFSGLPKAVLYIVAAQDGGEYERYGFEDLQAGCWKISISTGGGVLF